MKSTPGFLFGKKIVSRSIIFHESFELRIIFNHDFETRVHIFWRVLKSRLDQIIIQISSEKMTSSISVELELDGAGLFNDILLRIQVFQKELCNLKRRIEKGYSSKVWKTNMEVIRVSLIFLHGSKSKNIGKQQLQRS